MIKDPPNLYKFFNSKNKKGVTRAYIKLRDKTAQDDKDKLRLLWKISQDPYVSSAYQSYQSTKAIIDAGFFDDGLEPEGLYKESHNPKWITTPVSKVQNNFNSLSLKEKLSLKIKPVLVLLCTGAFAPIHESHLQMMEIAKKELTEKGFIVLGGYLSPSHDMYVKSKDKNAFDISRRSYLCKKAIEDSNWLMVDDWEGQYNKVAITYTEVISRLTSYLKKNTQISNIEVAYIIGADNAFFARSFTKKGYCFCVTRPGYENLINKVKSEPSIQKSKHVYFSKNSTIHPNQASSQIRKGTQTHLSKALSDPYIQLLTANHHGKNLNIENGLYIIRNDSKWATEKWEMYIKDNNFQVSLETLSKKIIEKMENILQLTLSKNISVVKIDVQNQQELIKSINLDYEILSIDPCINPKNQISVSRQFFLCDGQLSANKIVPRPGSANFAKQFKRIKTGQYVLVDDDIATGKTMNSIVSILPKRIKIQDKISLLDLTLEGFIDKKDIIDVNDLRDFIVGSKEAGLVVQLPNNKIARAPYVLPYVSPSVRSSIPLNKEMEFSYFVWEENYKFFANLSKDILLKDTNIGFQYLMQFIGFNKKSKMTSICNWHLEYLKKTAFCI